MSIKDFIYKSHCEGDNPSSKRLYGGVMIICSQLILIVATVLSFINGSGITSTIKDLIEIDIIVGSTLLGLTTVSRIFKDGSSISSNKTEQST
jgi:hypothetical protein